MNGDDTMTYEELIAENPGVDIMDRHFNSDNIKGLYFNGKIAINDNIETTVEKMCILAEELGHHYTSSGTIIDMQDTGNRKQEHIARCWAYNKLVTFEQLIDAFESGCRNRYEFAEYIEVTEQFLLDAMEQFKQKYGCCKKVGDYTFIFYPYYDIMKNF